MSGVDVGVKSSCLVRVMIGDKTANPRSATLAIAIDPMSVPRHDARDIGVAWYHLRLSDFCGAEFAIFARY
jgi:hypothetical protein